MNDNWQLDQDESAIAFRSIVFPVIAPEWFPGGQLVDTEQDSSPLAALLDRSNGIDCVVRDRRGTWTVARRVQWQKAWDSFTIRAYRWTGAKTERTKRLDELERGSLGPLLTTQAYVSGRGGGELLSAAVIRTADLFSYINGDGRVLRDVPVTGGNRMDVVYWRWLEEAGVKFAVWRPPMVHGAAHGAPTDEPIPPQPADTDEDAALMFGDDTHPDTDTLPTEQQSNDYARVGTFTPDENGWMA